MKSYSRLILCILLYFQCMICSSQFSDITHLFDSLGVNLVTPGTANGSGVSFYDFNNDGWDDISIAGGSSNPIFLLNIEGVFELAPFQIPNPGVGIIYSLIWVDFDNDGDADIFITKDPGVLELWQNDGNMNFTNISQQVGFPQQPLRYANATFGDYNHDGFLDLYVTKYYAHTFFPDTVYAGALYRNNGGQSFTDVTAESGVFLTPHTALQPIFADFNNDGWEDLFIAVDRILYPNELFINKQDGTFLRITESSGVNNYIDAMSATVGDYDRNGFMDIYVTNNPILTGNSLFRNNGNNTFSDMAVSFSIEVMNACWGATWIDYDNNGWEDLFVATMSQPVPGNKLFINLSGLAFEDKADSLGLNSINTQTYACCIGDLNNDGYFDLVTNNRAPYTPRLFLNSGGSNNFLSVTLEGTLANKDGIGSWIHCYVEGEHHVRYTHCGENLAGQNSRKKIIGLGLHTMVDSLVIEWNSGTREVYLQPDINSHTYYIEGASFSQQFPLMIVGTPYLCQGESVVLNAGEFQSYLWNTGSTAQEIAVYEPGTYWVSVTNQFGLSVESFPITLEWAPESDVETQVNNISCFGEADGSIAVYIDGGQPPISITWNNGATNSILENLDAGIYSFIGINGFGCQFTGSASVQSPFPLSANYTTEDVLCFGEDSGIANITPIGGTPPYSVSWGDINPEALFAGVYNVTLMDMNLCSTEVAFEIQEPLPLTIELNYTNADEPDNLGSAIIEIYGGTPPYAIEWSIGEIDVYQIFSLMAGQYGVSVIDANDCIISQNFTIFNIAGLESSSFQYYKVYPNPFYNNINIENVTGNNISFQLFNSKGMLLLQANKTSSPFQITLPELTNGIYFLNIYDIVKIQQYKLVKIE